MPQAKEIFLPIQNERISKLVEDKIKQAIFDNQFAAGDKIPSERELAEIFGVSRSTIHEALRSLEKSGFIVIKKGATGGGYVVKGDTTSVVASLKDLLHLKQVGLQDIAQARLIIEPPVCALAAEKAVAKDIERLEEWNLKLGIAFQSGNPILENDPRIHTLIAETSGNPLFAIIVKALMEVHTYKMMSIKLSDNIKKDILHQHKDIIEALKKKQKQKASEYMNKHICHVREYLLDFEKNI